MVLNQRLCQNLLFHSEKVTGGEKIPSEDKNDKELAVTIKTTQEPWSTSFAKTMKVSEVIQEVIDHYGFSAQGSYELRLERDPDNPLQPDRPLVSYDVKGGDVLVFTDLGVAVWP